MNCRQFTVAAVLLVFSAALSAKPPSGGGFTNPRYSMHMLRNEFDGLWSTCVDINNDDDIVGRAEVSLELRPTYGSSVLYVSRREDRLTGVDMVALSDFLHPNQRYSSATGNGWRIGSAVKINDSEQIVGTATFFVAGVGDDRIYRLILPPGIPSDPDNDLWGIIEDLEAPDLDPAGAGLGLSVVDQNNNGDVLCRGGNNLFLLTTENSWQDGGTVVAGGSAGPTALSDRTSGAIWLVGSSSNQRAWRMNYSVATGTFGAPAFFKGTYKPEPTAEGKDVNKAGQVTGWIEVSRSDAFACRITGNTVVNLGTVSNSPDWNDSWGAAINENGDIVGTALNGIGADINGILSVSGNNGVTILSTLVDDVDGDPEGDTHPLDDNVFTDGPADINNARSICGPRSSGSSLKEARAYLLMVKP